MNDDERSEKMYLGKNILTFRKSLRLSQEKLGDEIGVTRQTISNWECNLTTPDAYQLIAFACKYRFTCRSFTRVFTC